MIKLEHITKVYPGSDQYAVENLDLEIESGSTVTMIGPSGCGKTTTMRMINRLETPSRGRVLVDGHDIAHVDPKALRRTIGYVIQQVGLFPHMSIERNIATVPRLLGWERAETERRIDELLDLVGLDPDVMRKRLPHELSGGQRQRVGFARALAADPDIMLMDEPFGAIDPITRVRLQDEFRQILRKVSKTVVIVTHDLDEAIKMGDRIAIMRDGRLLQYDTPEAILANPANDFVESFLGQDRAIKRLALINVRQMMEPPRNVGVTRSISEEANLHAALSLILAERLDGLDIVGADGGRVGYLPRERVLSAQYEVTEA
ncbi:ABC transporter ATP-binding protein [Salinicola corii]|uniref:Quaternary amine transport ATP-binding protein n=1 Tax=Salinicola corii TaxID=2606937 RepID=A0A640WDW7_9GAMM|nr:ABC transporter ATP-binding protein [Salinicola corii]KAA0018158.1 ABC transporter ATP-binding protein [Salinicola corii]